MPPSGVGGFKKNMKKIFQLFAMVLMAGSMTSCFENPNLVYDGRTVVEFDATVRTAPAAGRTFPLIPVNNGAGAQITQINLVGPQRTTDSQVKMTIDPAATTAVEGTHFRIVSRDVTIPANTSFGTASIEILRVPVQVSSTVNLVLLLEGNGSDILPSENFKRVGYTIRLNP
jgi:hypothetical protein